MARFKIENKGKGVLPLPEVVSSSRTDDNASNWVIKTIGDPFESTSDVVERKMSVSSLTDETSRLFRVRELVRAKVSLNTVESIKGVSELGIDPDLLRAADELRINTIVKKMNSQHDISLLKNGSEKTIGERLATDGTIVGWNQAVAYGLSLVNTKGFNSFLSGVRSVNKEWAEQLREMSNAVSDIKDARRSSLADTDTHKLETLSGEEFQVPFGFLHTIRAAKAAQRFYRGKDEGFGNLVGETKSGEVESEEFETGDQKGLFAPLIISGKVPLTVDVSGFLHRKKRSAVYGKRILYPERMLTDPYRRVFGSKVRANGGVIVIDVSGSMSLNSDDIEAMLTAAPGALIMAYSHSPGSSDVPNLFILAERGRRVKDVADVPYRNGGNGVDGPALEYAIRRRKGGEKIIWVCDGVVTDCNDNHNWNLTSQCARLVRRHNIIVQPSMEILLDSIKKGVFVSQPAGPIGSALYNGS